MPKEAMNDNNNVMQGLLSQVPTIDIVFEKNNKYIESLTRHVQRLWWRGSLTIPAYEASKCAAGGMDFFNSVGISHPESKG